MLTPALFAMAKRLEQPNCPSTDDGIVSLRRRDLVTYASTGMNPEDNILSKISKS